MDPNYLIIRNVEDTVLGVFKSELSMDQLNEICAKATNHLQTLSEDDWFEIFETYPHLEEDYDAYMVLWIQKNYLLELIPSINTIMYYTADYSSLFNDEDEG